MSFTEFYRRDQIGTDKALAELVSYVQEYKLNKTLLNEDFKKYKARSIAPMDVAIAKYLKK